MQMGSGIGIGGLLIVGALGGVRLGMHGPDREVVWIYEPSHGHVAQNLISQLVDLIWKFVIIID